MFGWLLADFAWSNKNEHGLQLVQLFYLLFIFTCLLVTYSFLKIQTMSLKFLVLAHFSLLNINGTQDQTIANTKTTSEHIDILTYMCPQLLNLSLSVHLVLMVWVLAFYVTFKGKKTLSPSNSWLGQWKMLEVPDMDLSSWL